MNARASLAGTAQTFPATAGMTVVRDDDGLRVMADGAALLSLRPHGESMQLVVRDGLDHGRLSSAVAAMAEAAFAWSPSLDCLAVALDDSAAADAVLRDGLAVARHGRLELLPDMVMQRRAGWLTDASRPAFPLSYVMTDGKRHPLRPPKPQGCVYSRFIPWLSESVNFRVVDIERDLPWVHKWLNDPRVDAFWSEAGDLDKHRHYLARLLADAHMLPLIGCFGDRPFGYFELYWAKENRIAPFYDAGDYDRGWHVIVGEDAFRGRRFITAWLPSLMHYMFLDDARTERIVGEPAAAHVQQLRNLDRAGFARIKNFDFPHKRATLVMLLRERFFGDRLWQPAADEVQC